MASPDEKVDSKPGFTVTDRRSAGHESPPATPEATPHVALPPVELHTFLLSLGSSALMHLGEIESPESGQPSRNLNMAKHTIDVLAMLQIKTKGNLTPAEDQLLESLLFDLRLRYVEAARKG